MSLLLAYEKSAYTISGLSKIAEIDEGSIRKYLFYGRTPREKNALKLEKAMFKMHEKPRLKFHPSYGYATEEQIARLKEIGVGYERDQIMKAIEKQNEGKGKYL